MKIYFAHSKKYDFEKELYQPLRQSDLNNKHEIILPHEGEDVFSKEIIKESDLLIAEISYPGIGLGIELGWADTFDIPILCVYKKGAKVSSSVNFICEDLIEYEGTEDLLEKINNYLKNL